MQIAIIDYGSGNLRSAAKAFERAGRDAGLVADVLVTSDPDALRAAVTIATSSLVKTAWFGEDANWGRIMAALGRSGARVVEDRIAIMVGPIQIVRRGMGLGHDVEKRANTVMKSREFSVTVDLGSGHAEATVWTTDLTVDYIKINASYRS